MKYLLDMTAADYKLTATDATVSAGCKKTLTL
jgi:hypothetical protein